jgi:glycosyltransferase involved in cell wall biosynthesis
LVAEKGVQDLIDTCDALERHTPIAVAIAGQGPLASLVISWAAARGHRFYGRLEHKRILDLLGASDLLVVPSRTTRQGAEQFGRVAVEAISRGTPVVAYNCGALREVVADAGWVVPEGDTRALAAAIRRFAALPEDARADLRRRTRARGHQFSDASIAEKHVALWRRIQRDLG